jgi:hypothetical protein
MTAAVYWASSSPPAARSLREMLTEGHLANSPMRNQRCAASARQLAPKGWRPSVRLSDIIRRLTNSPEPCDREAVAAAPTSFPVEAYNAALDRLVKIAFESGARQEQTRITTIVRLPGAERFPRLAINIALSGAVAPEQALETFAAAESDVSSRSQPTEPLAPESDRRVLH